PRRYCRARPRQGEGRRARPLRAARIRSREAPCVRGAGGADRAHRASTEGRCHQHGGGAQTTGAAMTAAPASVQPITVEQLRGIVEGLGKYKVPPDDALAVLAAVLTGWQSCHDA